MAQVCTASGSQLREPGFKSFVSVLNLGQVFTLYCSSSLNCLNKDLAIDIGGYVYE